MKNYKESPWVFSLYNKETENDFADNFSVILMSDEINRKSLNIWNYIMPVANWVLQKPILKLVYYIGCFKEPVLDISYLTSYQFLHSVLLFLHREDGQYYLLNYCYFLIRNWKRRREPPV